ncbi:MAG: hypothetical protein HRT83_05200 [Hyphomicrobiaceae bacterium]|nr:hypothetical protein [Hyphomicrobiaceae bacterium]
MDIVEIPLYSFFTIITSFTASVQAIDINISVLRHIQNCGFLVCGTGDEESGFATKTNTGWSGIYIDLCRALATATLHDSQAIRFRPLTSTKRFAAVAQGEVDVLARSTALAFSSDNTSNTLSVTPFLKVWDFSFENHIRLLVR